MATAARLDAPTGMLSRHRARTIDRQQVTLEALLASFQDVRNRLRLDENCPVVHRMASLAHLIRSFDVIVRQRTQASTLVASQAILAAGERVHDLRRAGPRRRRERRGPRGRSWGRTAYRPGPEPPAERRRGISPARGDDSWDRRRQIRSLAQRGTTGSCRECKRQAEYHQPLHLRTRYRCLGWAFGLDAVSQPAERGPISRPIPVSCCSRDRRCRPGRCRRSRYHSGS